MSAYKTKDLAIWLGKSPDELESEWRGIQRSGCCVFDFITTSSLLSQLIEKHDLIFQKDDAEWSVRASNDLKLGSSLNAGKKPLQLLLFYEKVYLNVTMGLKNLTNWDKLKEIGLVEENPISLHQENLARFEELKPILIEYILSLFERNIHYSFGKIWKSRPFYSFDFSNYEQLFNHLYDQFAREKSGLPFSYLDVWDSLKPEAGDQILDLVENVVTGFSCLSADNIQLYTYANLDKCTDNATSLYTPTKIRDDLFVIFQIALDEELRYSPSVDCLADILRWKSNSSITRFREVFGKYITALKIPDRKILRELKKEVISANKALKKFGFLNTRAYVWGTTFAGFLPIISNIVNVTNAIFYEVKKRIVKKHDWICLSHKIDKSTSNKT